DPKNAVQPRMDRDGHGLKTGCVNERLDSIGEPFIVSPSVFIRVHPWFLPVQVPDLTSHSGKLGPLRLRFIAATEEHVGAPFQQSKNSRRQDEEPVNRASKEDPDLGL